MTENKASDSKRSLADAESPDNKKLKADDVIEKESELVVPLAEDDNDFAQLKEYYAEALEIIETEPKRGIELIQVTINEADRLLREFYEVSPQLFDGEFYLNITEELEFLEVALDRLNSALELSTDDLLLEVKLALAKALYHKAGLLMQLAGHDSDEKEQGVLDSAAALLDEASLHLEFAITCLFDGKESPSGRFIEPIEESLYVLEHAQLLADREPSWERCSRRNQWCQKLFEIALANAVTKLRANLGVAACLLSMVNYYFDHEPLEDDSDSEGEQDSDQALLIDEMNPSKLNDTLTNALDRLNAAIGLLGNNSVDTKARAYLMRGETHLNLGNLVTDESKELDFYRRAVQDFQMVKELQPDDLLPDSFQSFLEEWADQL
ncbi:hypothetical protein L0F63_005105 [Massospora cicadina]|nr:hypothetical protein L0F63_005105 [Massospora cicadina]